VIDNQTSRSKEYQYLEVEHNTLFRKAAAE